MKLTKERGMKLIENIFSDLEKSGLVSGTLYQLTGNSQ